MKNTNTLQSIINEKYDSLASKGKLLADYILSNPDKAVFMTTRQLASAAGASEATVVRFVRQLGFESYAIFISSLRDLIDQRFTLMERGQLGTSAGGKENDNALHVQVEEDIKNLISMRDGLDMGTVRAVKEEMERAAKIYVMGSRLSYSSAHYLGWTLSKIRRDIAILNGSDRTSMERMVFAPQGSIVIVVATSRYPNELIRLAKFAYRQGMKQILIADSSSCPLVQFSDHVLVAPQSSIPYLGNPVSIISMIHYLLHALAGEMGDELKKHQEQLEQAYLENDIWFN